MTVVPIAKISEYDISISEITVFSVTPPDGELHIENSRINSGLVCVTQGAFDYNADGHTIRMKRGDIFYLPKYSAYNHTVHGISQTYVVNFNLFDSQDEIIFTNTVTRICENAGREYIQLFIDISREYLHGCNFIVLKTKVLTLLDMMSHEARTQSRSKRAAQIEQAVKYLETGAGLSTTVTELARMCYMSENAFRSAFTVCFGENPGTVLIRRRISKACQLLECSNLSVGEIAALLEYCDTAYFSRIFKTIIGISPAAYRKRNDKNDRNDR